MKNIVTSRRNSQPVSVVGLNSSSTAMPRRRSALPINASNPPVAIMQADAKNAVPSRRLDRMLPSKIRGSRVTNWRIHSRRNRVIKTDTEGRPAGGFSVNQPMPNHAANSRVTAIRSRSSGGWDVIRSSGFML